MISVTIITKNEEQNIERCLRSVQWADEIIVVDAMSDDGTADAARKFTTKVIQREWKGFADQKEFALQQASSEWVLSLDADEEVTEELQSEILHTIKTGTEINGFEIPRKSFFLGKWIQYGGWYPGYQLRLLKKSKTTMNHRPVHEGFLVEGEKGQLKYPLNHYTYHSIYQYLDKMNDYSSLDVVNKISDGKTIRWYHFILNPLSQFLRMFFSLRGYKDGLRGFLLAYYSSLNTLAVYAKSWEYQKALKQREILPPVTSEAVAHLNQLSR
ncbi:MAG: glycosyltransferase family 2 protein [Bacteroidota bacterium]|nr:glycosyltransferase family 2 protein [Bacteroidota bacterium]